MTEESMIDRLGRELVSSLKSGDKRTVGVLRMLLSQLKNRRIEKRDDLTREEEWDVLSRYARQRLEAADLAEKGGRGDLAEEERAEHAIVSSYLPARLSAEEIEAMVREIVAGLSGPNMGSVMKEVMPRVKGRADGKEVREIVTRILGG